MYEYFSWKGRRTVAFVTWLPRLKSGFCPLRYHFWFPESVDTTVRVIIGIRYPFRWHFYYNFQMSVVSMHVEWTPVEIGIRTRIRLWSPPQAGNPAKRKPRPFSSYTLRILTTHATASLQEDNRSGMRYKTIAPSWKTHHFSKMYFPFFTKLKWFSFDRRNL